jgi:hypothetical protein
LNKNKKIIETNRNGDTFTIAYENMPTGGVLEKMEICFKNSRRSGGGLHGYSAVPSMQREILSKIQDKSKIERCVV